MPVHSSKQRAEAVVRRLIDEGFSQGGLEVADELIAHDCVEHQNFGPGHASGAGGVKAVIASLRRAFSDFTLTIEDLTVAGDVVWTRNVGDRHARRRVHGPPAHRPADPDRRDRHPPGGRRPDRRALGRPRPARRPAPDRRDAAARIAHRGLGQRSACGTSRRRPVRSRLCSGVFEACLRVVEAGSLTSPSPGRQAWAGPIGRGANPPPQFGQTSCEHVLHAVAAERALVGADPARSPWPVAGRRHRVRSSVGARASRREYDRSRPRVASFRAMETPDTATVVAPQLSVRNGRARRRVLQGGVRRARAASRRRRDGHESVVAQLADRRARPSGSPTSLREHGNFSPETFGGGSVRMLLMVDDPDAAMARAVAAGATPGLPGRRGARLAARPHRRPVRPPLGGRQARRPVAALTPETRDRVARPAGRFARCVPGRSCRSLLRGGRGDGRLWRRGRLGYDAPTRDGDQRPRAGGGRSAGAGDHRDRA